MQIIMMHLSYYGYRRVSFGCNFAWDNSSRVQST